MRSINLFRSDHFEAAFFRVVKWILRFLGLWPLDPITRITMIKIVINLSVLLTAIIGELRYTWLIRQKPIEALVAVCPCLTKMVTWMKLVCFVFYRKEIAKLLIELKEHLTIDNLNSHKSLMIARVTFFTTIWSMWLYFFGISTNGFYTTKPLVLWTYQRMIGYNGTWVNLPFQAALPYEDMTQLQDKGLYTFMYIFLAYSGNVTIFGFPGVDGAFICFCMYISVSNECLQEDFKQILHRYTRGGSIRGSNNLFYEKLSALVERQQNIFKMFNRFNRVYSLMIFGHFLFAAIILGVALVNLLFTPGLSKTIYVTYAMGACTQLYTYCYGAESINESCIKVSDALYTSNWYTCDVRVRKLLLFAMMKSQRGSYLRAPFFWPSIPLFAAIVKTSGSYITILEAMI